MGILSSIGKGLNDFFGATSASNAAFSQSVQLANQSFANQKEFAQNQVQWYADDLQKAGFNRALATGASSVGSGGATGGTGSAVANNASLLGMIAEIVDMKNSTKMTNAQVNLLEEQKKAIENGGFLNWWTGTDRPEPINATKEYINKKAEQAERIKKEEYTKEEREIAEKFDKFWAK